MSTQSTTPMTALIPGDAEVSNLSAILLDEDYCARILAGRHEIDGDSIVGLEYFLPPEARAWLDLMVCREAGAAVDGRDIKRHRNDVFHLFQVFDPEFVIEPSPQITLDMHVFLNRMSRERIDPGGMGPESATLELVIAELS